jgi:hypothetical protein
MVKYLERTLYNEQGIPMPKAGQDRAFEFAIEGWRT